MIHLLPFFTGAVRRVCFCGSEAQGKLLLSLPDHSALPLILSFTGCSVLHFSIIISLKKPTPFGSIVTSTAAVPFGMIGFLGNSTEAQLHVVLVVMITSGFSPVFFTSKTCFFVSPTFIIPRSALMGVTSPVVLLSSFSFTVSYVSDNFLMYILLISTLCTGFPITKTLLSLSNKKV